jgi:hypothetical protein
VAAQVARPVVRAAASVGLLLSSTSAGALERDLCADAAQRFDEVLSFVRGRCASNYERHVVEQTLCPVAVQAEGS